MAEIWWRTIIFSSDVIEGCYNDSITRTQILLHYDASGCPFRDREADQAPLG